MSNSTYQGWTQVESEPFPRYIPLDTSNLVLGNDMECFLIQENGQGFAIQQTYFKGQIPPNANELRGNQFLVSLQFVKKSLRENGKIQGSNMQAVS
jgi:hypothetical protein